MKSSDLSACGILIAAGLGLSSPIAAQESAPAFEARELERLASRDLATFNSESDFRRYLRDVNREYRKRHPRSYRRYSDGGYESPMIVVGQADIAMECDDPDDCPEEQGAEKVVVTGSRVVTPTITNVQVAGVDEGDIVKQIGQYLLVLQDGRIFAVHYPTMQLADRFDVYRRDERGTPVGADWYDEMVDQGDQVIITAYSYQEEASEISVFRLDQATGKIARRGVFLMTSDDYYDTDNYATRIVDDNLIIYTPYEAEDLAERGNRPVVRRW